MPAQGPPPGWNTQLPPAVRRRNRRALQQLGGPLDAMMLGGLGSILGTNSDSATGSLSGIDAFTSLAGMAGMGGLAGGTKALAAGNNNLAGLAGLAGGGYSMAGLAGFEQGYGMYGGSSFDSSNMAAGYGSSSSIGTGLDSYRTPNTVNGLGNTAWSTPVDVAH
ncbi:hypothetical protein COO60DRAFT_1633784 [Scenedesmus sp. NREL 46B-D3]|nr:hypothetical protein COO60DRAFT_1633784 [Scenedesmus sp. NREL 46B-D3]